MMCFPKLQQCFCCLSLRTGMQFICWISLLWSLIFLCGSNTYGAPLVLRFLDSIAALNIYGSEYSEFSQLYYVVQVTITMFALIGIYSNSTCCLNLLIINETLILLLYVIMTGVQISEGLSRNRMDASVVGLLLTTAFKYYVYLVILSYYNELSQGRDGTGRGGVIITTTTTIPASYAVPQPACNPSIVPSAPYADSPYAVQPPHAPVLTQPWPQDGYPNLNIIEHGNPAPCAPPPYLVPQSTILNEKPPPYAP